jgi:hypothetical protein
VGDNEHGVMKLNNILFQSGTAQVVMLCCTVSLLLLLLLLLAAADVMGEMMQMSSARANQRHRRDGRPQLPGWPRSLPAAGAATKETICLRTQ